MLETVGVYRVKEDRDELIGEAQFHPQERYFRFTRTILPPLPQVGDTVTIMRLDKTERLVTITRVSPEGEGDSPVFFYE